MKGKHTESPIISNKEYLEYAKKVGITPAIKPESIILCYSKRVLAGIQDIHQISEIKGIFRSASTRLYTVEGTGNKVGILAGFGVGAPATIMHMEELMAWEARRFVILGMAGGINEKLWPGDIVVCTKSIRDEGTSHHYLKNSKYAFASKGFTETLFESLSWEFKKLYKGSSWTIDAPYRETVKELIKYRSEGVLTVEMEAAAIFAVGQVKGVETAAVFAVSDLLTEKSWESSIRSPLVVTNLVRAFKCVKDTLVNLK